MIKPIRMDAETGAQYLSISRRQFYALAELGCFGQPHCDALASRGAKNAKRFWLTRHIEAYAERAATVDPVTRLQELQDASAARRRKKGTAKC